jgi:hypothetical protein
MKRLILPAVLIATASCANAGDPGEKQMAMEATGAFGKALKAELITAMKAGGPLEAIDVCNTKAPGIAKAVSLEQGVQVSRVSTRNRNPGNAPNDWQAEVLASFEKRIDEGEDAGGLSWQETVDSADGKQYRFMKAIPTGGVCLACHGTAIDAAVAEKIAELYPQDRATGFSEGELRGAFVVVREIPQD